MNIEYTTHAKERMDERGITEEDINIVLQKAKLVRQNSKSTVKQYQDIAVAYFENTELDKLVVITVFKPEKSLERRIVRIPKPQDWWHKEDKDVFINQGYFLLEKGLDEEEIIDHLTKLFNAVCGEFGENRHE